MQSRLCISGCLPFLVCLYGVCACLYVPDFVLKALEIIMIVKISLLYESVQASSSVVGSRRKDVCEGAHVIIEQEGR